MAGTIQPCHVSALASYSRKLGTSRLHLVPEQAYPAWFSYSVAQENNRLGGKTPPDFGSNPREIRRRHVLARKPRLSVLAGQYAGMRPETRGSQTARECTEVRPGTQSSKTARLATSSRDVLPEWPHTPRSPRSSEIHPSRRLGADPALQRLRCKGEVIGHQDKVRQELEELIQVLKRGKSAPRAPDGAGLLQQKSSPLLHYDRPYIEIRPPGSEVHHDRAIRHRKIEVRPPDSEAGRGSEVHHDRLPYSEIETFNDDDYQRGEHHTWELASEQALAKIPNSVQICVLQSLNGGLQAKLRPTTGSRPGATGTQLSQPGTVRGTHINHPLVHASPANAEISSSTRRSCSEEELSRRESSNCITRHHAVKVAKNKVLGPRRRVALALWKGLTTKLLEEPKARAQMERGFLADVEEADNAVRRIFERKMGNLGLSSDQMFVA